MAAKGRTPRRLSRGEVDPGAPVALWFLLTALAGQGDAMLAHAQAFCAEAGNARVVDPGVHAGNRGGVRCVYVVVAGGALGDAVRGGGRGGDLQPGLSRADYSCSVRLSFLSPPGSSLHSKVGGSHDRRT
jgi:hypothetical protein